MIAAVAFGAPLRAQFQAEARAAYPRECCGLIEAPPPKNGLLQIAALHPAGNLAAAKDRFEIDPADQFRLLRSLRGTDRKIAGCYHSHPGGRAQPSAADRAGAGEEGFLWLIGALGSQDAGLVLAAFEYRTGGFRGVNFWPSLDRSRGQTV